MSDTSGLNNRFLLVEDQPLLRDMVAQLINNEPGMTVCAETDNIRDAMSLIEQKHPDVAIIEIALQGSSGLGLLKNLKAKGICLPILVLSMRPESLYAERVIRAGARGYISKLEPPFVVIKAIRKVSEGHIYLSETIKKKILERLHGNQKSLCLGIDSLSDREVEIFQLIGRGLNTCEISRQLNIGSSTVDSYRARIKAKLGIKSAAGLHQCATQWQLEGII